MMHIHYDIAPTDKSRASVACEPRAITRDHEHARTYAHAAMAASMRCGT